MAVLLSSFSPVFASLKSKGAGVVQGPGAYAEHGEDTAIGGGKTRAKGAVLQL
ncbi:hypothetical protein [Bartonella sp. WD16.2]|uniref:hypothetical protein n=1 Tax=Bartonella sp. WD16.2 TaxID=1933904 RepID=UPI0012946CE8|nr:hypothetical protein [Bartonella sp. WD16.2]